MLKELFEGIMNTEKKEFGLLEDGEKPPKSSEYVHMCLHCAMTKYPRNTVMSGFVSNEKCDVCGHMCTDVGIVHVPKANVEEGSPTSEKIYKCSVCGGNIKGAAYDGILRANGRIEGYIMRQGGIEHVTCVKCVNK